MKPVFRSVVMPTVGMLLMAAVALGAPATPVLAADPGDSGKTQTVTVAPAGDEAGRGTVNLQGFVQPLDTRSLAPLRTTTSVVSHGGIETGTVSAPATAGSGAAAAPHSPVLDLGTPARGNGGLIGGYAGYRFNEEKDSPGSGYGINVQVASDPLASADIVRLQPGLDYRTFLSPSWQVSSRLYSTYAVEGASGISGGRTGLGASDEASGFRDIGLSLGLGYAPSESWTVQTQAAYARQLRALESDTIDGEPATYQFFGGVISNYKF